MNSTATAPTTSLDASSAREPGTVRAALELAPRLPHHPRVARLEIGGRPVVIRSPRPGEGSAAMFAAERDVNRIVAGRTAHGNGPLAEAPLLVTEDFMVHEDLGGRWSSGRAASLHEDLSQRWSTRSARRLGFVLAALHSTPVPLETSAALGEPPVLWPLTPRRYASTPDAALAVLRHLDGVAGAGALQEEVRHGRRGTPVLVHGDLKPDNVLLVPSPGKTEEDGPALRLVDWELAGRGAVVTDVAALLAGLSLVAVQSLAGSAADATLLRRAVQDGSSRAVRYLALVLASYRQHSALDLTPRSLALTTAARLLARAQAVACLSGTVTALSTLLVGLAGGLLHDVARSTEGLRRTLDLEGTT